jgi:hypothetical protein
LSPAKVQTGVSDYVAPQQHALHHMTASPSNPIDPAALT